jgi:hypothetical protein
MMGDAKSPARNGVAASLMMTGCVLVDLIARQLGQAGAGAALPWLLLVTVTCFLAVLFRQAWAAAVPAVLALLAALSPSTFGVQLANVSLSTSLVFLARSRAFSVRAGVSPELLATCGGWSCAAGLTASVAASGHHGSRLPALFQLGLGIGLALCSRARRQRPGLESQPAREFWRGFVTYLAAFLLLIGIAILGKLSQVGANSGSATPGAWPAR